MTKLHHLYNYFSAHLNRTESWRLKLLTYLAQVYLFFSPIDMYESMKCRGQWCSIHRLQSGCVEEADQSRPGCEWFISPNDDCYLTPTLHWPSCNPSLDQRKFKPWSILLAPNSGWEDGATDSGTQRQRYLSPPQWHHQENPTGSTEYSLGENSFRPPHHTSSINNLGDRCKKLSSLGGSTITEHTPLPIKTGILLLLFNVFLCCMLKSSELSRFQR